MRRVALCLLCLCLAPACKDPGQGAWQEGRAQYEALVLKGTPSESKAWDAVLATLQRVPEGSKHHAEAQRLVRAITQSRVRVRRPLAIAARSFDGGTEPEVVAAREECVRLARARADGGVTPEFMQALDECRERAEKLDAVHAHREGH